MSVSELLRATLGDTPPIRITVYDGTEFGPEDAETHIHVASPDAIRRIIAERGRELGFARGLIAGDIEIHGDIFGLFEVNDRLQRPKVDVALLKSAAGALGVSSWRDLGRLRPPPPPEAEVKLSGRRYSKRRDSEAIKVHYDISNEFYERLLGPSMTYSCALFETGSMELQDAQAAKHDLVCRKLGLKAGMRMLDIGCGWGGLAIHAARNYGVSVVGATISEAQGEYAKKQVKNNHLSDQIEIRVQDYRDISDGPFDAVSSVGMAEHVGSEKELGSYYLAVHGLLAPGARFLNHAIGRSPREEAADEKGFIQRFVFPDGRLHELGRSISLAQEAGFEAIHMESLRPHYAKTLRLWLRNLEANEQVSIDEVGEQRYLIWRLYLAGSAVAFERGRVQVHQVLYHHEGSDAGFPMRPDW